MGTYEEIRLRVSDDALSFQGAEGVNLDGSDPWPDRLVHDGDVGGGVGYCGTVAANSKRQGLHETRQRKTPQDNQSCLGTFSQVRRRSAGEPARQR